MPTRTRRRPTRQPNRLRRPAWLEVLESRCLMAGTPVEIDGVQPAALDQPRINAMLSRSPGGAPIDSNAPGYEGTFNIQAFYDTGASGLLLSEFTADALGVQRATYNGQPVRYFDVGVAGSSQFDVSEPVYVGLAPFSPDADIDNPDDYQTVYNQQFNTPMRTQIGPPGEPENPLLEGLDVFGMPVFRGKTVVMDPRPVNTFADTMRTYVYNPGTPYDPNQDATNPGIPSTSYHLQLSYASFDRFSKVLPAGAPGPTLRENPFIGPNPVNQLDPNPPADNTPPVTIARGGLTSQGSFLLDTGAAASILSLEQAIGLNVTYQDGTYLTDAPVLVDANTGVPLDHQFRLSIGGIGGSFTAAGFFLDSLTVQTTEGTPLVFKNAPVLVADVSVYDEASQQALTLDGVFGMNYLVASAFIDESGGDLVGFGDIRQGGFDWVVFDDNTHTLGLELADFQAQNGIGGIWIDSTAWKPAYRDALQINDPSARSGDLGYALKGGAGGFGGNEVLPWNNANQFRLAIANPDVNVDDLDVELLDSNFQDIPVSLVSYDANTHIATWQLTQQANQPAPFFKGDRSLLLVSNNATGNFFFYEMDFLPGDADQNGRVDAFDTLGARAKQGSNATTNTANYSVFYDVDGNGRIDAFDTLSIRAKQGSRLPSSSGGLGAASAASGPTFATDTTSVGGANLITRLKDEGVLS